MAESKDTKTPAPAAPAAATTPTVETKTDKKVIPVVVDKSDKAKSVTVDGKTYEAGEYRLKAGVGKHYRPTEEGLVRMEPGETLTLTAGQAYAFADKFVQMRQRTRPIADVESDIRRAREHVLATMTVSTADDEPS